MESDQSHPDILPLKRPDHSSKIPASLPAVSPLVSMRLSELFPLLLDAIENDRTWLSDFADEEIRVSSDLNDVVQAYASFRRSA